MTKDILPQKMRTRHDELTLRGAYMERVEVTDLYQASYYLLSGCEIMGVECIPAGKGTSCRITVQGANLVRLADDWFDRQAVVNLWTFRNAYTEINSHVQQAKRSFELSRRFRREGGDL